MNYKTGISKTLFPVLITCFFCCFDTTFGQTIPTTAVPFLLINTSPEANGLGTTSVSRMTEDNYSIITNPAHIGLMSFQTSGSFSFYPAKVQWLPSLGLTDVTLNVMALNGGLNLNKYLDFPFSIGIAYSRVYLNLGTFNRTSTSPDVVDTYEAEEHADAISVGVGVDFGIQAALGLTFRRIESNIADFETEPGSNNSTAWSRDYGLLFNFPITTLIAEKGELLPQVTPLMNISIGSALTNVGGKMYYVDRAQADPLPRNISFGTSVEFGFTYARTKHNLFMFTWSRQSDNILVGRDGINSFYRGGFGDVDLFKNIIQGKRTETIDLSQGWQIGIGEILFIRGGSLTGSGNRSLTTDGFGLQMSGFFKLLKDLEVVENNGLSYVAEHVNIRYDQSEYRTSDISHPLNHTKFSSFSVDVKF